jgi:hypothetical protein
MNSVPGPIPGLDCSDAAQAARRQQLEALLAKIRSGVTSVGDRGRSVQYGAAANLWPIAQQLQKELLACELGYWPSRKRLAYIDHVKGL